MLGSLATCVECWGFWWVWGVVTCTGEEVCVVGETEWDNSIGVCFLLYRIFILYLSKELF